ncbi:autotransporter outer membrane beta-barrel domain-containing protein [Labrys neptuniae]
MSPRLVGKHKKSSLPLGATLTVGSPVRLAQRSLANPKALTSTIAIAAALSCGGMVAAPGAAFAGSCDPATFVCSGAAGAPGTDTPIVINNPGATAVTTQPGFGINAGGTAITIIGSGTGDVSFNDANQSSITGASNGIVISGGNTGTINVASDGVITSGASDGIIGTMGGTSTGLTINVNEVNAADHGINLNGNNGTGDISVTANTINADTDHGGIGTGITFDNGPNTHNFTVNVGTITGGGGGGISGFSSGDGNTDITVGTITTTGGHGVNLVVDASPGAGYTKVDAGDITANGGSGIVVDMNANTTDLTITANNVTAGANGIQALNGGTGKSAVTTHGNVTATGLYGIYNANTAAATGDLTVNTDAGTTTHGSGYGIYAENNGTGNLIVTANGSATTNEVFTAGNESGILAINNNTTGNSSIQITAGDTTGAGFGIRADNHSNGGIHIESNGTAYAGFGIGGWAAIEANNFGTGDVYVKANNAYGDMGGVNVVNADAASGSIDVIVTGKATTRETEFPEHGGGNAVNVIAGVNTKAINVTVNNATGTNNGIYTEQHGTGTTSITTTGIVEGNTGGIMGLSFGAPIDINNSGTVRNTSNSSLSQAIYANGPATVTNSGSGLITGSVQLVSDKGNTVNNAGTWDTAGATNEFGAGTANNSVNNTGTIIAAKDGAAVANTVFNNVGTFKNGGVLTMADEGAGDTTTIKGDYVGNGGTVEIDTELGDDSSKTDKLVIEGDATGSTKLTVHNVGGLGAQTTDGIKVIEVGGTSDANAFRLTSAVAAGAYDYGLYMGGASGANDWFLRSTNELNSEAQTSVVYAGALSHFAQATLGTLQQRTGGRIWPNGESQVAADLPSDQVMKYAPGGPVIYGQGAWGRVGGLYASYDPKKGGSYTQGIGFLQAGYEGTAYETTNGEVTLGAYATVGRSWVKVDTTRDPVTGAARSKGKITSNGYGVGVNATWLGNDGLYADAIGQFTWYDTNLSNKNGSSQGWASALSLEVGKRFDVGSGWSVVPQAQLSWTHVDFSSFTDTLGNRVSLGDGDSVLGRVGVRVENLASWKGEDGETRRLQFYGIANLSYEFMGDTSVKIAGATVEQQDKRLWGEIGTGATYAWNDKSSLYAEASYGHALASGDNYSAKGTVGFRYKW